MALLGKHVTIAYAAKPASCNTTQSVHDQIMQYVDHAPVLSFNAETIYQKTCTGQDWYRHMHEGV